MLHDENNHLLQCAVKHGVLASVSRQVCIWVIFDQMGPNLLHFNVFWKKQQKWPSIKDHIRKTKGALTTKVRTIGG